jgi:hypothetical protein
MLIGATGGAFLLAAIDPSARQHRTVIPRLNILRDKRQVRSPYMSPEAHFIRREVRERMAAQEIARHYTDRHPPGWQVALVFGRWHDFSGAFQGPLASTVPAINPIEVPKVRDWVDAWWSTVAGRPKHGAR